MKIHDPISSTLPTLGSKLLSDAQTQAEQLGTDNSQGLHDFRVSVRRLRSFLQSYEDFIKKDAKKHRQRLSDIMTLTNAGRDNEVHMAWLQARRKKTSELEQEGIHYLLENLSSDDHVKVEKVKKQFAGAAKKLGEAFSGEPKKAKASFTAVTAEVLQDYSKDLEECLAKIETSEDDTALHDARIAGKKLRYTLELLESQEAEMLVKKLKHLQDIAGELHDLHLLEPKVQTFLFAETVLWSQAFRDGSNTLSHAELSQLPELQRSYALAAVHRTLEAEKVALFQDLQQHWLGAGNKDFFKEVGAFVNELAKPVTSKKRASKRAKKPAPKKIKKPVLEAEEVVSSSASDALTVN
jgi:CHAD domain-containing protein